MDQKELSEEQVFDSLMQEMLTGQHPPDLSARILAAIAQETSSEPKKVAISKSVSCQFSSAALPRSQPKAANLQVA